MAIFFIGSLAASLAQTSTQLIVFRALTGVGGGGLMTVAQVRIHLVCISVRASPDVKGHARLSCPTWSHCVSEENIKGSSAR